MLQELGCRKELFISRIKVWNKNAIYVLGFRLIVAVISNIGFRLYYQYIYRSIM